MQNFKPKGSQRDTRIRYVYYPAERGRMVKIEIHHRDGGRNYFSGANEARGIEIMLSTIEVSDSGVNGIMMESSTPMSGENGRMLLLETPRYSAKKVESLAKTFDARAPEISALWSIDRNGTIDLIRRILNGGELLAA